MSDSLTDAQKIIAEVAAAHRLNYNKWAIADADFYTCKCGLKTQPGDGIHAEWWDAHLAVEIDKALGGLTTEESFGTTYPHYPVRDVRYTRVVGGWTPEESP